MLARYEGRKVNYVGTKVSSYFSGFRNFIENLGVYHESLKLGVGDRVRLYIVFVRAVHSGTSAVLFFDDPQLLRVST